MRYFVVSDDGNKYGPADLATLNSWIQEGRLVPSTLLEEEGSAARVAASAVSGLSFPAPAPTPVEGPGPGFSVPPGPANPYNSGYSNQYQAPAPQAGNTEMIVSWVCGGLGLVCCCGLLPIAGIIFAIVAKNKGHKSGTAALVFNIVVLALSLVVFSFALIFPNITKGFTEGMKQAQQQQTGQYQNSTSFTPSPSP